MPKKVLKIKNRPKRKKSKKKIPTSATQSSDVGFFRSWRTL